MTDRLAQVLRRRGAPPATVDDAVQTAVLRALTRADGFDSSAGLFNWLIVVAWHEVQAEWRRTARINDGEVPDQPTNLDPAVIVQGHLELDAVADGLAVLSPAEREVLLLPLREGADGGPDKPYVKMRRHRARQHLAEVVGRDPASH